MSLSKLFPESFNASTALAATAGALALGGAVYFAQSAVESRRWRKVGVVDRLFVHPLKGGKLKEVTSLACEPIGPRAALFRDRCFSIANDE